MEEECRRKRQMLQRKAVNNEELMEVPPIVHEVLNSSGQLLDENTRLFMESRFGHDFSKVRVHTDTKAAESAESVNALAYTVGSNVVFGAGHYSPATKEGKMLLAHELMHVTDADLNRQMILQKAEKQSEEHPPLWDEKSTGWMVWDWSQQKYISQMIWDDKLKRYRIWSNWVNRYLLQLEETQMTILKTVESERMKALNKTIKMIQNVQYAILAGIKRYPAKGVWDQYHTLFKALSLYMLIDRGEKQEGLYYDYYNNKKDENLYAHLNQICEMLSQNLSFRVFPGRYLIDDQIDSSKTGARGEHETGIIFPPSWFEEEYDYQLLTLTHEYFHVMTNPIIDDYPALRSGTVCGFDKAIKEPNCLSALSTWVYTNNDAQGKYGVQPCHQGYQ